MSIEEQEKQIARIFKGAQIAGVQADIRFIESKNGRIDAVAFGVEQDMVPLPISFAVREQTAEEAVIADLLSKFIAPDEIDSSTTTTVLEVTNSTDTFLCAFRDWGYHVLTQSSYDSSPQMTQVMPSTRAMDRLVAAWIKWRIKNYVPPVEDDGSLADLKDHPF